MTVNTDFSAGPTQKTGNPLDFAISGEGFFSVQTPEGVRYTRDGRFSINEDGELVTLSGYPVLGEGGPIQVDGPSLAMDETGTITIDGNPVDRFKIVTFQNPMALKKIGDRLFAPMEAVGGAKPAEAVQLHQGVVEQSNVTTIRMMTEMIEVLRSYESYQKAIRSIDEATAKSINDVGRV
jgi:flagellar basal-body rod protein FlgG